MSNEELWKGRPHRKEWQSPPILCYRQTYKPSRDIFLELRNRPAITQFTLKRGRNFTHCRTQRASFHLQSRPYTY